MALKVTLTYVYLEYIVTNYGYYGFISGSVSSVVSLTNWIVYIICSAAMTILVGQERVSTWIISFLFCISYTPCLVYFQASGAQLKHIVQLHLYWFSLLVLLKVLPRFIPTLSGGYRVRKFSRRQFVFGEIIIALLALYVCIIKYSYNGLYIHLDVVDVYGLRLEAADKNLGFAANYFISWACLAFTIRGVSALHNRQFIILTLIMFLQVIIFSIAAHKFYLFALPTAILASVFYRKGLLNWIPLIISCVLGISVILYSLYNFFYLIFLLPFRNMFLPALITEQFYDFFEKNSPDLLTQSVMGRLGFVSDYTLPIPFLIDSVYLGDGTGSANTGLSADAVSNFGFFGILIYPVFFAVILKFLDSASNKIIMKNNLGIIIFFTIAFLNTAFFTALLTGGVLFCLFFLHTQASKDY